MVTMLGAVLSQLRRARAELAGDAALAVRLDRTIDELEVVGQLLLTRQEVRPDAHAAPDEPTRASTVPEATAPADAAKLADEERFLEWLLGCGQPSQQAPSHQDEPTTGLPQLLRRLSTSSRSLPPEAARILGRPEGISVGDAATEILLAVRDPAGPRCRTYRAAVYFLHERVDDWFSLDLEVEA